MSKDFRDNYNVCKIQFKCICKIINSIIVTLPTVNVISITEKLYTE